MVMSEILFVVNPAAGSGRANGVWQQIEDLLRERGLSYHAIVSTEAGVTPELVRERLKQKRPDRIVAVGGDGTVSEVVNGYAPEEIPLGVVAAGSGNDFARYFGLSGDPVEALEVVLNGTVRRVDLGRINDRYMINVGGAGFDAKVADETNRMGKRLGSTLPYVVALLKTLITWKNAEVQIELDGETLKRRVLLVAVGNGQYLGGGMHILPSADMEDGVMDICIGEDLTKSEVVGLLAKIYKGQHVGHPKITMKRAKKVRISSPMPLYYHADGEPLGMAPVTFEILPGKLLVLC